MQSPRFRNVQWRTHARTVTANRPDILTYLLYLLTAWNRVLLERLTGLQPVKKFPAFHGTRRSITALTSAKPTAHILSQLDAVHTPTSHFLKIHFNINLPSTSGSPKWSVSLRFPHQKPCVRLCYHPFTLHARSISFFSILLDEQYWVRSTDH